MPEIPDEELVRRLLADARHEEPMPADVVTRLDGVLHDLATERDRTVTALHTARSARRRRWAGGLVAAAAVVTAVAVAPHVSVSSDSDSGAGSSSSASDSSGRQSSGEAALPQVPPVAVLRRDTLAADVRAARQRLATAPETFTSAGPDAAGGQCAGADRGAGTALPAQLDGRPAVLVLRPAAGGRQVADVLACGTARVVASVTLPAR